MLLKPNWRNVLLSGEDTGHFGKLVYKTTRWWYGPGSPSTVPPAPPPPSLPRQRVSAPELPFGLSAVWSWPQEGSVRAGFSASLLLSAL